MNIVKNSLLSIAGLSIAGLMVFALVAVADTSSASAANPCAAKNPCGGNKIDTKLVTRPSGTQLAKGSHAALVKEGKKLFNDATLGTNDISCQTCHEDNGMFKATFAKPYPHKVDMAVARGGIESIQLDEMIQFCILVPMAGKPLPWDSRKLAALTAYTASLQKGFSANPCGGNPCGGNPCGGNPCAAKNPCGGNPCAANPCAKK